MNDLSDPSAAAAAQPPPVRLSRTFHARPETVFRAWSAAEHVKRWFSPQTYSVSDATVELRVGGRFDVCMRSPGGVEHWTRGTCVEVSPDTRLVIDSHVSDTAGGPLFQAFTEVDFCAVSGGTQLNVTQRYTFIEPSLAAPMVAGASEGWDTTLDKLEREVRAMQDTAATDDAVVHAVSKLERTYDAPVAPMSSLEFSAAGSPTRSIEIEVGRLGFDAIEAGPSDGPLAIFLHGWPEFADMWTPIVEMLGAQGRRAVAVDQRGYSPRARPSATSEYAIDKLVGDVFGFADALGVTTFDLVAHDWGGIVAWIAAAVGPSRIRSLTVLATPHPRALAQARAVDPDQQRRLAYVALHVAPDHKAETVYLANGAAKLRNLYGGHIPADRLDRNIERLTKPGALTATLNWYRAALAGDAPDVSVPTLFIWGSDDIALGERAALATADCVRGPYRFERLDGISHWIADEVPDRVLALVGEHLAAYSSFVASE